MAFFRLLWGSLCEGLQNRPAKISRAVCQRFYKTRGSFFWLLVFASKVDS